MTVDHVYIYWYQSASNKLYVLDKVSGTMSTTTLQDVTDILAFGAHLQPLPGNSQKLFCRQGRCLRIIVMSE